MRRAIFAAAFLSVAGFAVPAMAAPPPPPVGVGHNSSGDVCVYAFTWVPQCLPTSQVTDAIQPPPTST
jgi:hypothetical protein